MPGVGLIWDLLARDQASPAFLRVAGAADKAAASTAKAAAGMSATTARMGKVGKTLTRSLTVPLLGIAAVSVDQAAKFQKSMTLIQTAGGETAAKTAVISRGLMSIAKSTGTSLGQLSDGIYTVAKAGGQKWSANDQLLLMKAAAQGAKAENVDLGTATNALTSIMTSYGAKASDAVKYENMLIRGSGLAKTSMQEFAGSLSNVVPLASSLGIGFDQVAGAIDTMTQHGESAQQSTDNLNNLIRNLAGGNNVAASTMLQLGINTVSLSKTLSSPNGLSKALAVVHEALLRHSKDGMVVVDMQKASVLATRSLSQMMGTFSGSLKEQSHELLSGKEGITTYQKYAKSLGGAAGAGALQFLALYKSSKGFSDQLKAGRSTTMSATQALQKMLGGATGLNVALMLGLGTTKESANSATIFGQSIKSVADAAKNSGADVLGWAKTQDTLAVKMDKAKASLQVMAVELGTALIPAISKMADAGSKAAHWVDGLSGGQKKVLLYTAGVLAALGPILTIGARLRIVGSAFGNFAASAGQKIATLAGASAATASKVASITRGMTRSVSGILAGAAAAQVGGNSRGGWLASILLGAAGGGALGGVVGAAVGGVSAAIFKGVGLWNDHKNAAKAAALAERGYVNDLTSAIQQDNGALGTNLRLSITKQLQDRGILDQAQKLGLNLADVVSAAVGSTPAKNRIAAKLSAAASGAAAKAAQILAPTHVTNPNAVQKLISGQSVTNDQGKVVALSGAQVALYNHYVQLAGGIDKFNAALRREGIDVVAAKKKADQYAHALNDNRVASGGLAAQMQALSRHTSTAVDSNGQFNASLSKTSVLGQHNRNTILDLAGAALSDANNTFAAADRHHKFAAALKIASGALKGNIANIETQAAKAGFSKTQVDNLITSLHLYSGLKPTTTLHLNTGPAQSDLQSFINNLPSITVTAHMKIVGGPGSSTYNSQVPKHAKGGPVRDGFFTMGESSNPNSWELGLKQGSRLDIYSNLQAKRMTGWNNVPGFAAGTKPPITHSGKDWIVNGVRYASERAAKNAQGRAGKTDQGSLSSAVSSAIGNVGSAPSLKFNVSDVGIGRIRAQIAAALRVLGQEVHKGLSKHTAGVFRAEIASYVKEANRQLAGLRVKIKGSDLTALHNALKGTVDDTKTAIDGLLTDLTHAGASARTLASVRAAGSGLMSAQARLTSATDYRSTISGTLAGGFDPTHFGSVGDLIAGYQGQTGQNKTYAQELTSLRNRAGKNSQALALINTLAASGQTNSLEALAQGSSADLNNAAKAYQGYNASLGAGADAATQAKFDGKTVAQLHDDVTKQVQTTDKLIKAVGQLARAVGNSHNRGHDHTRREIDSAISELETLVRHGRA